MERCGAKNYLVEIGGECRCQGVSSKGIPWRIGIETPFDGNMSDGAYLTGRIRMSEGGLATSATTAASTATPQAIRYPTRSTRQRAAASRHDCFPPPCRGQLRRSRRHGDHVLSLGANKAIALSRKIPDAKVYLSSTTGKTATKFTARRRCKNDDSRIIPLRTNETSSISL